MIDKMVRVDLRVVAMDVPPQDVITRDNVSVKVNAVLYFRVLDPNRAIISVENYLYATSQLAQTTLRSVCGQAELDDLLAEREKINAHIQEILDKDTDPWGIKVAKVEIKHIDLPQEMQRAMAKQAEAERERRPRSSERKGSSRRRRSWPMRRRSSASIRSPCSCGTSRHCGKWRQSTIPRPSSRFRSICSPRF